MFILSIVACLLISGTSLAQQEACDFDVQKCMQSFKEATSTHFNNAQLVCGDLEVLINCTKDLKCNFNGTRIHIIIEGTKMHLTKSGVICGNGPRVENHSIPKPSPTPMLPVIPGGPSSRAVQATHEIDPTPPSFTLSKFSPTSMLPENDQPPQSFTLSKPNPDILPGTPMIHSSETTTRSNVIPVRGPSSTTTNSADRISDRDHSEIPVGDHSDVNSRIPAVEDHSGVNSRIPVRDHSAVTSGIPVSHSSDVPTGTGGKPDDSEIPVSDPSGVTTQTDGFPVSDPSSVTTRTDASGISGRDRSGINSGLPVSDPSDAITQTDACLKGLQMCLQNYQIEIMGQSGKHNLKSHLCGNIQNIKNCMYSVKACNLQSVKHQVDDEIQKEMKEKGIHCDTNNHGVTMYSAFTLPLALALAISFLRALFA